jgi:hypothetical protein
MLGARPFSVAPPHAAIPAAQHAYRFCFGAFSASLCRFDHEGARDVDIALRLNMLAVLAVFAFVGAILLGAF